MKKSFEDILNEKAQDFQMKLRSNMWENIESQLPPEEKKKRVLFFWNKPFLVAASLLLLVSLALLFNQSQTNTIDQPIQVTQQVENSSPEVSSDKTVAEQTTTIHQSDVKQESVEKTVAPLAKMNLKKNKSLKYNSVFKEVSKQIKVNKLVAATTSVFSEDHFERQSNLIAANGLEIFTEPLLMDSLYRIQEVKASRKKAFLAHFFAELTVLPLQNASVVEIENAYKEIEPYQSTFDNRSNGDMGMKSKNFSLSLGTQINHWRMSVGFKQSTVRYSMLVNNVRNGISNAGAYNKFDYFASDTFAIESAETGAGSYSSEYQFTSVPIKLGYQLNLGSKFSLILQPEISYNRLKNHEGLIGTTETGIYVKPDMASSNTITRSHWAYAANAFVEYNVFRNLYLGAGLHYNRAINPIEKGIVSTRYQQAGMQFSLRYQFNGKKYLFF